MFKRKIAVKLVLVFMFAAFSLPTAADATECGLSCCIAGAAEGIGAGGKGLNLSIQYEWMKMGTILDGTSEKSPDRVLDETAAMMYSVPKEMIMQKMSVNIAYGLNEKVSLLASIPYVKNEMDMRMKNMMTRSDMSMDTVEGVGDVSLMGFFKLYADRDMAPTERVTLGVGLKTPTGKDNDRENGNLMHMMMQRGTGSWDPLLALNGMKAFGKTYLIGTFTYQYTTENDRGYEVGDRLSFDITGKRMLTDLFNISLALNYVHTDKDKTDGSGNYQNPMMSMVDNVENTGLDAYFITPGLEFKPAVGSPFSFKASAKIPVRQDVNGMQLVMDDWYVINAGYRF